MSHTDSHPDGGSIGLRLALQAMGTRFELLLADDRDLHELRAAGEAALACVRDWHVRLSVFDPGSLVSRINATAHREPVRIDLDMLDLFRACERLGSVTAGAFDVAVGALMDYHGFRAGVQGAEPPAYGMEHVEICERQMTVRFRVPGVKLDFGAIAKGWAIDRALDVLRESGVRSALLHGGTSTIGALGSAPGNKPWRVRIEDDEHAPIALLTDASLSVSAPKGRLNDSNQGHVIDPRTGMPSVGARLAAALAVYSDETDAISTALVVLNQRPGSIPAGVVSILPAENGGWDVRGDAKDRVEIPDQAQRGQ